MFPYPRWHIQLQSEAEALRTKASVESLIGLFLGIQNQKYANVIPKWAELVEKRMNFLVSKSYATMPRNEFSTIDQGLRKNSKEATIVL